ISRAISIDPYNPFAYFYIGRAYLAKDNYDQALTFLHRAEINFRSDSQWLGETLAFEGAAYEESNRPAEAALAYKRALDAAPYNRLAIVGFGRLAPAQLEGSPTSAPGAPARNLP